VYGSSRGKRSEGCNPKDATGTKQGRKGAGRSVRRETARNRTRRLPGGGKSGMTCCPVPDASKGTEPQERCRSAMALRRPLLASSEGGAKAMRGCGSGSCGHDTRGP
jgi:hypothetical protein